MSDVDQRNTVRLLDSIYKMAPNFAFLLLVPFYFLELLVAFIQAFVFCFLTLLFVSLAVVSHDGNGHGQEAAEETHHA